ncbi:MAG: DUF5916 domain-containing protein, partial [Candidatus Heimdallarchaeota archaeon]
SMSSYCKIIIANLTFLIILNNTAFSQSKQTDEYTISARKIENNAIKLDGMLDEDEWQKADAISDLIQSEPNFGNQLSEKTIVRILYDDNNIYIGTICYYKDLKDLVANKLAHRDIAYDDHFGFVFDTFLDRTKGYYFITNAFGAKEESFIDGVNQSNLDWNEVWQVKTQINQNNWTAEFKIPLRILRFPDLKNQTWGFNVYRSLRKKNERGYWTPIPPQHLITNLSLAGRLIGLKGITMKRNLQVRPYVLFGGSEDRNRNATEKKSEIGLDLKYVPLPNLAFDLTYNTDFAQIESDDEQINLSRFSLFYPEKRDFFLENAQLFRFGLQQRIQPFFSRRIGIHDGNPVPVLFGTRLTGKLGRSNLGILNITTEKTSFLPLTNYTVLRVRQDILKNSNFGFIFTNVQSQEGFNRCWGLDSEIWLSQNSRIRGFYSSVDSREINSQRSAALLTYSLNRDLFQLTFGYVNVGKNYAPATGFVIINNIKDYSGILRKSFRPRKYGIRKLNFIGIFDYTYTQANQDFMRQHTMEISTELESGDMMYISYNNIFEKLYEDFKIYQDIIVPVGKYTYDNAGIEFEFHEKRKVSGKVAYRQGSFYDGNQKSFSLEGLLKLNKHLIIGEELEYNDIELPYGNFTTTIARLRLNFHFTSNLSLKTFFQYNSSTNKIISNVRLYLLHGNDNDLYVAYNNISSTQFNGINGEVNTAVLKINYRIYL